MAGSIIIASGHDQGMLTILVEIYIYIYMHTNIYISNTSVCTYIYICIRTCMYICASICCTQKSPNGTKKSVFRTTCTYVWNITHTYTYYVSSTHFIKQKHLSLPTYVSELAHCRFIRRPGGFELKLLLECGFLLIRVKGARGSLATLPIGHLRPYPPKTHKTVTCDPTSF